MNCPSRTDEPLKHEGWNQNPPRLAADLTTREDLSGMVNLRNQRNTGKAKDESGMELPELDPPPDNVSKRLPGAWGLVPLSETSGKPSTEALSSISKIPKLSTTPDPTTPVLHHPPPPKFLSSFRRFGAVLVKFGKFVGPGFMISVAYIDPGNYSTDVAAGASTRFKLLFIIFMSNVFAILLQSLAVRLGTVTGLNLAENCRTHLPRWLNITLYIMGEAAIIATDIAEVCFYKPLLTTNVLQANSSKGDRIGNSAQPAPEGTSSSRMCTNNSRRPHYSYFLPSEWHHAALARIRVLRYGFGDWSCHLLLYTALIHKRYVN